MVIQYRVWYIFRFGQLVDVFSMLVYLTWLSVGGEKRKNTIYIGVIHYI